LPLPRLQTPEGKEEEEEDEEEDFMLVYYSWTHTIFGFTWGTNLWMTPGDLGGLDFIHSFITFKLVYLTHLRSPWFHTSTIFQGAS